MTHTLQLNCVKSAIFCNFVKWKRKRRRKSDTRLTHTHTHTHSHTGTLSLCNRPESHFLCNLHKSVSSPCFLPFLLFACAVSLCANAASSWQPQFPLSLSLTHSGHALSLCLSRLNALNFGFALSTNKQIARKSHAHCTFNLIHGDFLLLHTLSIV